MRQGGSAAIEQVQRNPPGFAKGDGPGHVGLASPLGIAGPVLGQKQAAFHQRVAVVGRVAHEDAAILPRAAPSTGAPGGVFVLRASNLRLIFKAGNVFCNPSTPLSVVDVPRILN